MQLLIRFKLLCTMSLQPDSFVMSRYHDLFVNNVSMMMSIFSSFFLTGDIISH